MNDPRLTPMNARVAAAYLAEVPEGVKRVEGVARRVAQPVLDLLRAPDGRRDRQLQLGETVRLYENREGWAYVRADKDGYVGYVESAGLWRHETPTHWVAAAGSHAYCRPDIKSRDRLMLGFGMRLRASGETGDFIETDLGFVPRAHVLAVGTCLADPVEAAARLLGTPYLWGGNSRFGIDCSGLVQAAFQACGLDCPGDSDMQERELGDPLPVGSPARRGDLMFWPGHVAIVSSEDTLLHANACHMAVCSEPLGPALERIAALSGAPLRTHRRLTHAAVSSC